MANFAAVLQSSGKLCNRFANCCSTAPDMDGGGLTDRGPPFQGACREGRGSEPGSHGLKSIKRGRRRSYERAPLFPLASPERRPGATARSNSGTERRQSSERKLLKSFRLYANEKDPFFLLLFYFPPNIGKNIDPIVRSSIFPFNIIGLTADDHRAGLRYQGRPASRLLTKFAYFVDAAGKNAQFPSPSPFPWQFLCSVGAHVPAPRRPERAETVKRASAAPQPCARMARSHRLTGEHARASC